MKKNTIEEALPAIASRLKPGGRILFANVPADGHFNPLTGLAVHLKQVGYDVRWYSSSLYEEKINRLNIPYYPFKRALQVTGDNVDEIFPERRTIGSQVEKLKFDMINFFILRSTEYYDDITEIHNTFPFDLMIADCTFSAIPIVKEKMNKPVIAIGVMPLTETSKDLAPVGLGMTPLASFWGRRKQDLLRFVADNILFAKPTQVMRRILKGYGIDARKSNVFDILAKKATLLLQSGTPSFEYKRADLGKNIRFIGALLPHQQSKKKQPWYAEKLETYEKVILVTQGTVERDANKIIVPLLDAFKNSRKYLVIVTTGGSGTFELRERFPFHNIIIEDFIPFDDVMPHADIFVTNGGYGGVMLAIQHQLPLVVAGVHEGKNEINARIGYFNLGINLGTETPKPQQLLTAITGVLRNDMYRKNVVNLAEEFSYYDPQALTASYVRELIGPAPERKEFRMDGARMMKEQLNAVV
jgi:UDP:flavonoid glycosyltransferase YjiC (YdhE family)